MGRMEKNIRRLKHPIKCRVDSASVIIISNAQKERIWKRGHKLRLILVPGTLDGLAAGES